MESNKPEDHNAVIARITQKVFGANPDTITRMSNGICNEVYLVATAGREVIVRLHVEPRYMLGSHNHIPVFKSKGLSVPDILAEDYSKTDVPLAYQVLTKMEGRDIVDVIDTLNDDQLRAVGGEIANIFRQLSTVPNNGKFGVLWGDDKDLVDSWSAEVARVTKVVIGWGTKTGVIDDELKEILKWINSEYKSYFDSVRPYTYFGDLSSKNVMIHDGRFAGLVGLDSLAQGDPLEAIGRIKTSWYGTHYGQVYSDAIMDALNLSAEQRKLVTMYALLNRVFWTCENGVQFNQNTSRKVDQARMEKDKAIVRALNAELRGSEAPPTVEPEKPAKTLTRKPKLTEPPPVPEESVIGTVADPQPEVMVLEPVARTPVEKRVVEPVAPPIVEETRQIPVQRPSSQ
ncbi:MAG TPA: phosphotransferase, partial [Pyrinomonadaceae bacterium]|nr:phosphotransferase [Pyrinomonadaceae bacterium]